jgi:hypothetical protein
MKLYVLLTIDGRTYTITGEQKKAIVILANSGQVKTVEFGDEVVFLSSLSGIPSLEAYRRQMRQKLSEKKLKMCKRCGTIGPREDACPCKEQPEKYPDLLDVARQENPSLAVYLDTVAQQKSLPAQADD